MSAVLSKSSDGQEIFTEYCDNCNGGIRKTAGVNVIKDPASGLGLLPAFIAHDVQAETDSISVNFWYRTDIATVSPHMLCRLPVWLSGAPKPWAELKGFYYQDSSDTGSIDVAMRLIEMARGFLGSVDTRHIEGGQDFGWHIDILAARLGVTAGSG